MSFKITYPPGSTVLNNILGGGSIPAPNYLKFISLAASTSEVTIPAGCFLQRISLSDPTNPVPLITVTSLDMLTTYSELDCSGGSAVDLIDIYFAVATTIKFNNLTGTSIGSVQYYRHPSP